MKSQGDKIEAESFWQTFKTEPLKSLYVGTGNTPNEAIKNLYEKWCKE